MLCTSGIDAATGLEEFASGVTGGKTSAVALDGGAESNASDTAGVDAAGLLC